MRLTLVAPRRLHRLDTKEGFEHTGEFREPKVGEWFLWGKEIHLRCYSGSSTDYWILRKVGGTA